MRSIDFTEVEGIFIFYRLFLGIKKRALNGSISRFYRSWCRINFGYFMDKRKRLRKCSLIFIGIELRFLT